MLERYTHFTPEHYREEIDKLAPARGLQVVERGVRNRHPNRHPKTKKAAQASLDGAS